jgi:hypothetical protein
MQRDIEHAPVAPDASSKKFSDQRRFHEGSCQRQFRGSGMAGAPDYIVGARFKLDLGGLLTFFITSTL